MKNDLFTIGALTVHAYGLMIAVGVIAAVLLGMVRAKRHGKDPDGVCDLTMTVLIFGFLGAKILYLLVNFQAFLDDPSIFFDSSGFVVYGGLAAGILAAIVFCRIKKLRFLEQLDLYAPCISLAQGFGRIGCFLAGCCYGRETSSPIGVIFPAGSIAPSGVRLLPTQLFSSAGDFLLAGILLLYSRKKRPEGDCGALFLILYGIGRFVLEFFRSDSRGVVGFLSTSQFVSIFAVAIGAFLFLRNIRPRAGRGGADAA